jgi:hypothetical protein
MNKLDVEGAAVIGTDYAGSKTAPANGLLVQGNVGIGTTGPMNKLDVEGAAVIGTDYAGSKTAPINGLLVQGNVGIGVQNPAEKVHIENGNLYIKNGYLVNDNSDTGRNFCVSTFRD